MDHKLIAILLLAASPYPVQVYSESSRTNLGDSAAAPTLLFSDLGTAVLVHSNGELGDCTSGVVHPNGTGPTAIDYIDANLVDGTARAVFRVLKHLP
jgi:hypothetical protein